MNPWQIAKESELSHQQALFCWCNKAEKYGFGLANQRASYEAENKDILEVTAIPVPELKWIHAVPNGVRTGDAKARIMEGGALKAAGVKAGVLDIFWPYVVHEDGKSHYPIAHCGLAIEMKAPKLKSIKNEFAGLSDEQKEYGEYLLTQSYKPVLCYSWIEAAKAIEEYYNYGKR